MLNGNLWKGQNHGRILPEFDAASGSGRPHRSRRRRLKDVRSGSADTTECQKTQFLPVESTTYSVLLDFSIIFVVFPASGGEHNRQFSDGLTNAEGQRQPEPCAVLYDKGVPI